MDFPLHRLTKNAEETEKLGEILGASYRAVGDSTPRIVVCIGDLGSGKTTFVKGLGKGLGLVGRLLSPTFIIVRRYDLSKVSPLQFLYHLDLYRTHSAKDALGVGITEMLADPDSVTVIEWPDRLGEMKIQQPVLVVTLTTCEDGMHDCIIERRPQYENAH